MRRTFFGFACSIALAVSAFAQSGKSSDIELVESIPIETTLDNSDIRNTLEVWLEMINGAKSSLDIEQFYISNKPQEPLEEVIRAIERAAGRGVRVRVIGDSRFYKTYPETIDRLARHANISTRIIDYGKLAGGVQHAKFFIVDREEIFLGSQNFDWRALKHIHELGLRIKNAAVVRFYHDVFTLDWNLAETNDRERLATYLVAQRYDYPVPLVRGADTLLLTPTASPIGFIPDPQLWDEPNILRMIDAAEREVSLQFLGYDTKARDKSEYRNLDNALRRAAERGATVRMIVSDWEKGTQAETALKELSKLPNVEVRFIVIPEWSGGYVSFARVQHCKFIVVDGRTFWLGTSNAEKSYFYGGRNIGVIVHNAPLAGRVQQIFMKSWNGPYAEPVRVDATYERRKREGE